jgi:hypothetical protein
VSLGNRFSALQSGGYLVLMLQSLCACAVTIKAVDSLEIYVTEIQPDAVNCVWILEHLDAHVRMD